MTGRKNAAVFSTCAQYRGSDLYGKVLDSFVRTGRILHTGDDPPHPTNHEPGQNALADNAPDQRFPCLSLSGVERNASYSLNINSKARAAKTSVYIIHTVMDRPATSVRSRARPHVTVGLCNPVPWAGDKRLFFSLPHSQLVISLTLQLDLTGCENAEDVMHTKVDIEVPFTAGEFIDYQNQGNIRNLPDYLVNRDPFFRKILDSSKPPEEEKKPEAEKPAAK